MLNEKGIPESFPKAFLLITHRFGYSKIFWARKKGEHSSDTKTTVYQSFYYLSASYTHLGIANQYRSMHVHKKERRNKGIHYY